MIISGFLFAYAITVILAFPAIFFPLIGHKYPIQPRSLLGLHILNTTFLYGVLVAADGSVWLACGLSIILLTMAGCASCIKYRILGEPVLFTDVISLWELLKNPRFFLFSIPWVGWLVGGGGILALPFVFWWCAHAALAVRLAGCFVAAVVVLFYKCIAPFRWAPSPDWRRDVGRLGILGMLVIYWRCWKMQPSPPPHPSIAAKVARDVVVIVQCESFADPAMFGATVAQDTALPALMRAAEHATWRGGLQVSGFGAYTMRTEYGVLFGREEADLGFRQYDPLLTAEQEKTYALSYQLRVAGYHTVFMHPHNLAFYGRDRLMPAIGFDEIDSCSDVSFVSTRQDPYMPDSMLADRMIEKIRTTPEPLFLYAVTMENHAPWPGTPQEALGHYLRHLQNSDRMVGKLMDALTATDKAGLLVFFGDHRPSIPGVNAVTAERTTPYVAVEFPTGASGRHDVADMTPAALHHRIARIALQCHP